MIYICVVAGFIHWLRHSITNKKTGTIRLLPLVANICPELITRERSKKIKNRFDKAGAVIRACAKKVIWLVDSQKSVRQLY
jgi:hypothetical protein